jgi:hypothetical protein
MRELDSTYLKELFNYYPETGIFTWKIYRSNKSPIGGIAGCNSKKGYMVVIIDGKQYQGHRLAWLYHYGSWPKSGLDHINNIRNDNRIANIREATQSENSQNLKKGRGKFGLLGVSIDSKRKNRWKSTIKLHGKQTHLGWHKTPEEAHQAYIKAKRELHPFGTL